MQICREFYASAGIEGLQRLGNRNAENPFGDIAYRLFGNNEFTAKVAPIAFRNMSGETLTGLEVKGRTIRILNGCRGNGILEHGYKGTKGEKTTMRNRSEKPCWEKTYRPRIGRKPLRVHEKKRERKTPVPEIDTLLRPEAVTRTNMRPKDTGLTYAFLR